MIEERFSDAERQLLIVLVTHAMTGIRDDPFLAPQVQECHDILSKLYGTDTVLVAHRAYESRASRLTRESS